MPTTPLFVTDKVKELVRPKVIWEERVAVAQLRNKVSICYNGTPQTHPQNCPFDDHHPRVIHSSLDRPHSPSQTASGSTQPFCHNSLSGQRHTQTVRWSRCLFFQYRVRVAIIRQMTVFFAVCMPTKLLTPRTVDQPTVEHLVRIVYWSLATV